jgi:hypothetical protein
MIGAHGFDFTRICVETAMDFYQQVTGSWFVT